MLEGGNFNFFSLFFVDRGNNRFFWQNIYLCMQTLKVDFYFLLFYFIARYQPSMSIHFCIIDQKLFFAEIVCKSVEY